MPLLGTFHIKNTISQWKWCFFSGPDRIRTDDPHNANVVRSQLRYKPITIFFDLIIIAPRGTDVKIFHGKNEKKLPHSHNIYPDQRRAFWDF